MHVTDILVKTRQKKKKTYAFEINSIFNLLTISIISKKNILVLFLINLTHLKITVL